MAEKPTVKIGSENKVLDDPIAILEEVAQECDQLKSAYDILVLYADTIPDVTSTVLRSILEYRALKVTSLPDAMKATGRTIPKKVMQFVELYASDAREAIDDKDSNNGLRMLLFTQNMPGKPATNNVLREVIDLAKSAT